MEPVIFIIYMCVKLSNMEKVQLVHHNIKSCLHRLKLMRVQNSIYCNIHIIKEKKTNCTANKTKIKRYIHQQQNGIHIILANHYTQTKHLSLFFNGKRKAKTNPWPPELQRTGSCKQIDILSRPFTTHIHNYGLAFKINLSPL